MPTFDAPEPRGSRAVRPLSRRDLPVLFLLPAILCGFFAVFLPVMAKLAMATESDLKYVAGTVEQAPRWLRGRSGGKLPIIEIRVETDDGSYVLHEQDLSHARDVMNLRPGDRITARVKPVASYHTVWELKRDGVTIQSYQESYLYQAAQNQQAATDALLCGLVAAISLTVALALRMHFGTWRDPTYSASGAATD